MKEIALAGRKIELTLNDCFEMIPSNLRQIMNANTEHFLCSLPSNFHFNRSKVVFTLKLRFFLTLTVPATKNLFSVSLTFMFQLGQEKIYVINAMK